MSAPTLQNRVVIVDDDGPLCELLAELIRAPGRVVETVDQLVGLTPELIALSQPRLVVLNPRVAGLKEEEVHELILKVRELTGARFVLMVNDDDTPHAERLSHVLGADSAVPIRVLLRNPLQTLIDRDAPSAPPPAPAAPSVKLSDLGADDILEMDFDSGPTLVKTPGEATQAAQAVSAAPAAAAIRNVIDEELQRPVEVRQQHLFLTLDTLSECNVAAQGPQVKGVFVVVTPLPPVGTPMTMTLTFPWGAKVEVEGTVAWHLAENPLGKRRRGGVGVALKSDKAFTIAAQRFAYLRRPMAWPADAPGSPTS